MHQRERVVIYGLLSVLLAVNVAGLLGRSGAPAMAAAPVPAPTPAAAPDGGPETGPATGAGGEAVRAITLKGEGEAKDLVIVNRGGRIAWGDGPQDRAYTYAFVYIGKILNRLMQSGTFEEDRDRLVDELGEKDGEYRGKLDDIYQRLQGLDPESADARQLKEEGGQIYQEYMTWQQEALARRGKQDAEHLERAYRELIEAVEVVAERKGIDLVYRFIPTSEPFGAENPEQAMNGIRLRTALRYPEELDITAEVIRELALD